MHVDNCVCEFKYGKTAKAALKQCYDRDYAAPYAADGRTVVYVGINYDTEKGGVDTVSGPIKLKGGPLNHDGGPINQESGPIKLLRAIQANPGLRKTDLSTITGITQRSIKRYLDRLGNRVEFRGSKKTGGYYPVQKGVR